MWWLANSRVADWHADTIVGMHTDAIGMGDKWPPFSRQYVHVSKIITEAAEAFVSQVKEGTY